MAWQVTWRCDGCGELAEGCFYHGTESHKPPHWFVRKDGDGVQVACSRRCIELVAERTGKTGVILPV